MRSRISRIAALSSITILTFIYAQQAQAHHSFSRFNQKEIIEVEGELVSYRWRNPHITFKVRGTNDAGEEVVWDVEGHSVSILRRTNASPEGLEVGDRIRIAAWATVRPSTELFAHNLLLPDGRELVMGAEGHARWSIGDVTGDKTEWLTAGTGSKDTGREGIFRVWSTYLGEGSSFRTFWKHEYPLTEAGQQRLATWNPLTDTTSPGCSPKGMPLIMEQPYPLEFVSTGADILIRLEEYDTVRTIHMNPEATQAGDQHTLLGYSTGYWDDQTLVVSTVQVDFPYFDPKGTPQGSDPGFVEQFRVSDDGSRLLYELTATDEEVFTEPVTVTRDWVWRPGEQVKPYDCDEGE